jgi:hypothetical protein
MAEKKDAPKKAEHPDTPSGLGLQAAEGEKDEAKAAELYQEAKRKARWG